MRDDDNHNATAQTFTSTEGLYSPDQLDAWSLTIDGALLSGITAAPAPAPDA